MVDRIYKQRWVGFREDHPDDQALLRQIRDAAKKNKRSFSAQVKYWLEQYLEKKDTGEKENA